MPTSFSLAAFLPYRLAVLSERVSGRLSVVYGRTHGLTVAEWRVLVHLQRSGEASVRDIHQSANLEKPRVSRAVDRLVAAGFVQKLAKETDGRLVAISLTPAGGAALAQILPEVMEIEARLLAALTPDEQAIFLRAMDKLHATLDADPDAKPRMLLDRP